MGDFKLSDIKEILQTTTSEIKTVQNELSRDHGNISNQKVEKLKDLLNKSEIALKKLKNVQASGPAVKSEEIQNAIDQIMKAKQAQGNFNPAVLQAILSSMQVLNNDIGDIIVKEGDHKRGERVANVDYDKL